MNISGSDLFKDFARPILQPEPGDNWPSYTPLGIMQAITRWFMNHSKIDVYHVKLSNPSESTCDLTLDCRIAETGPISVTITPMELDLCFRSRPFGKLKLPEIETSYWGSSIQIKSQPLAITDMGVYHEFVRNIVVKSWTTLELENGNCKIKVFGPSVPCVFRFEVPIRSLEGPSVKLIKAWRREHDTEMTFQFNNPGPVEVDYGKSVFHLKNYNGELIVELHGDFSVVRGRFLVSLRGTLVPGVTSGGRDGVWLVGARTEMKSWANDTIKCYDKKIETMGAVARFFSRLSDAGCEEDEGYCSH